LQQHEAFDLEEKSYIKGTHIATIYHNETNLYSVVRIRIVDTNELYEEKEVVVTGYFPQIYEHDTYVFYGTFKYHPRFGRQYVVDHFRKDFPNTKEGVIQYLSSDLFKGIGKKTAQAIVDTLGENAISLILADAKVLQNVPKLSKDKAKALYEALKEHQGLEQIMISLSRFGFGPQLSMKIYQVYRDKTLKIIQENPYQLVEDVEGIGFRRADELGGQLGISGSHPDRIRAGCLFILEQDCLQEGHTFLTFEQLLVKVKQLLEDKRDATVSEVDISREIDVLVQDGKLIRDEDRLYVPSLYFSEKGIVTSIKRLLQQTEFQNLFPESEFLLALGRLEERLNVQYAPLQKEAIQKAISSPLFILTGGPGTGKTTVIRGIVEVFADLHGLSLDPKDYDKEKPFPVLLAAPTGRAAKRMSESTGLPAVTIHRLLGWNGVEGFAHDEDEPISGKLLIVDEMSMVDTWLAHQLFKALPSSIQVVLVGDEDQLPSVGPGQVLKDLLRINAIPTVRLTEIYRQAEGSSIIELAHHIKNGELPLDISAPKSDRSFIKCNSSQVLEVVRKVVENAKNKGYTWRDIQVLAPMYRGNAGIDKINEMLRELFNPQVEHKRELTNGEVIYRVGDKVLQLMNQPDQNVFNGDIGEIVAIFYAKENTEKQDLIVVSFEGNEVTYTRQDLGQITHAYCCSIHKAQGSEFPIVILPIVKSYYRMLRRNLIYTAVTRSRQYLIMCGEEDALRFGITRCDDGIRQTTLQEKLTAALQLSPQHGELPLEEAHIGMENVSPYDFMKEEVK